MPGWKIYYETRVDELLKLKWITRGWKIKLVSIVIKKPGETKMNNYLKDEKKYSMKIPWEKKITLNYDELGVKTLVNIK